MSNPTQKILAAENLGVPIPAQYSLVVRPTQWLTPEERERVQKATEYNAFAFPAPMLVADFLSDSGTSAMTDVQWAGLLRGDEAYGRNHGYFALIEAVRDTFERGNDPKHLVSSILSAEPNMTCSPSDTQIASPSQGGFANGGRYQLVRPNFFIAPQGRCAEHLLFSTMREILQSEKQDKPFVIPSNGFFDTTEAQAHVNFFVPQNLFASHFKDDFPLEDLWSRNTFKGDIDLVKLKDLLEREGRERVPIILMTITNNTAAGQPVSMGNLRAVYKMSEDFNIPVIFDAARFAENAFFIREFEEPYKSNGTSIPVIIKEMFTYCDGFTFSMKKDALCNIGGLLCLRDQGRFQKRFDRPGRDVGVHIKEKQILTYGNDSYGGMSGRDIMAATIGLYQVIKLPYLQRRIYQTRSLAASMAKQGVPVILPVGGHAIYLDMNKFFAGTDMKTEDFGGVGFVIELLRLYGIRACELGPFAFEWDQKTEEARKSILNLVRFAVPRNVYSQEHVDYTVAAVVQLYKHRELIPKVKIARGHTLHLRHFQSGLEPVYAKGKL